MTPTVTRTHQAPDATTLDWTNLWMQPDHAQPINFGVDQATDSHGTKFYRAFASAGGGLDKTLHSPVYEACDAADMQKHESYVPETTEAHNRRVSQAAVARSVMEAHQKAPSDMRAIAMELQTQARQEYDDYLQAEDIKARQRVYDDAALLAAKHLVRGLQLLMEHGTQDEKDTIKKLFHNK